ncbi:2,3-bisphosphoglycerate-dependent phosphoglycerate mutase [Streptomyces californicus]
MADAPYKLILLRHGESEWNAKNLFTGWVDVNLTEKGEKEAVRGGELLKDAGLLPDVLHTSLQRRAIRTAQLALESADRLWIPVRRSWRLNERHYGALQGKGCEVIAPPWSAKSTTIVNSSPYRANGPIRGIRRVSYQVRPLALSPMRRVR